MARWEVMGAAYRAIPGVSDIVTAGSIVVLLALDTMSTFAARWHVVGRLRRLRRRSVAEAAGMHVSDVQKKRDLGTTTYSAGSRHNSTKSFALSH